MPLKRSPRWYVSLKKFNAYLTARLSRLFTRPNRCLAATHKHALFEIAADAAAAKGVDGFDRSSVTMIVSFIAVDFRVFHATTRTLSRVPSLR